MTDYENYGLQLNKFMLSDDNLDDSHARRWEQEAKQQEAETIQHQNLILAYRSALDEIHTTNDPYRYYYLTYIKECAEGPLPLKKAIDYIKDKTRYAAFVAGVTEDQLRVARKEIWKRLAKAQK